MKYKKILRLACILGGLIAVFFFFDAINHRADPLETSADTIIAICKDAEYRPSCYDREIPRLMDQGFSMEGAFGVTRIVQDRDDAYQYCHVLGHLLSAKETAKDPSKWKEVITRSPSGLCSNGAIHGAFQERFRVESLPDVALLDLKKNLDGICEPRDGWSPTRLEQATCTHALGHLTMYVTDADINKALSLCDEIALNKDGYDMRQLCYDGVFMQIYQPLEPDDFSLIAGKEVTSKEQATTFCDTFTGRYRSSCVSESWPLSLKEIQSPKGFVNFCLVLTGDERNRCYTGIMYVLTAISNLSEEWVTDFCPQLPGHLEDDCFAHGASRIIETDWRNIDKAVHICEVASIYNVSDACYQELVTYSTYNFKQGSDEYYHICGLLPTAWKEACLRQPSRE
jgi:hypothetical protein